MKKHDHRQSTWLIAGGAIIWCYQCGAWKQNNVLGAKWHRPSGIGGKNPAMASPTKKPGAIPSVTARLKCMDCHHEQDVTSAGDWRANDGTEHHYFGSSYDHCNKCDGPMKLLSYVKKGATNARRARTGR